MASNGSFGIGPQRAVREREALCSDERGAEFNAAGSSALMKRSVWWTGGSPLLAACSMKCGSYPLEGETMATIADTVQDLVQERSRMAGQIRKLDQAISVLRKLDGSGSSGARKSVGKRRTLSAAARRKIAAAQKARWAKWKAAQKKAA